MFPTYRESERPRCPFCGEPFERPPREVPREQGDFYRFLCSCGAVGALDVTGHNLGDALMETIAFAYGNDWELALAMEADEDYDIKYIDCYHPGDHRVLAGHSVCKTGMAAFVFVKQKSRKHLH
ncbi:MAG: hypothetical protein JRF69_02355 [Deltaproteobacteria bacterium]|nr:hypothetical protein [Deltaproteobacteria bacterium]